MRIIKQYKHYTLLTLNIIKHILRFRFIILEKSFIKISYPIFFFQIHGHDTLKEEMVLCFQNTFKE